VWSVCVWRFTDVAVNRRGGCTPRNAMLPRVWEAGVCRGSDTPNYLCGGDIDMYIPLEKPNT